MLFGEGNDPKDKRWSNSASIHAFGEKLQDHLVVARSSLGSGGNMEEYKQQAKEKAGQLMEKGSYVAAGAYTKASQAKHAALDWITNMTNSTSNPN